MAASAVAAAAAGGTGGVFRAIFHAAVLAYYYYVDHLLTVGVGRVHLELGRAADDPEILRWRSGIPYYFTFWNLILHKVYFTCCCIDNLSECFSFYGPIKLQKTAQTVRRILFSSLFFPYMLLVVINFWALAFYDPDLVFVQYLYAGPSWVNHACHTFILPIVLLEMYLRAGTDEPWGKGTYLPFFILQAFNLAYGITGASSVILRGCWPYPVFDLMSKGEIIMFYIYVHVSSTIWLWLHNYLVNNVWGTQRGTSKPSVKKKAN
ncbi:androgen-dependent TFPI-regulating protein-like [Ischnura elegans]|uniref:androgen-dependent TFPI-regulating protein-like n=1 Tax=Ischnura elegans TaxID=197161 RepID=UPI001ED8AF40|nr:androgen-dependent TFPI-regulating protein-like [Ischnura elegans]